MKTPRVSVLMPVYNTKEEDLHEAVDSILTQNFQDFEFIILDDASTLPHVKKVLREYRDPRIIFAENESNLGISKTRNKLLDMAKGEYLAIMDHDDISMPERFDKQVAFLDKHPDVGVVGSHVQVIPNKKLDIYPLDNESIEQMLTCDRYSVMHPAAMIRKDVLMQNNIRYNEKFTPAEDYDLLGHLIGKTKFGNIPEILFKYRWNKQNTSYKQKFKMKAAALAVKEEIQKRHPDIYLEAKAKLVETYNYKLFGFIPIMSVRIQHNRTMYLLFGFFPILKRKYKESINWKSKL